MIWDEPPKRPTPEDFERVVRKIEGDIERIGWSAIGVIDAPPFTYTVGLTETFDHPELIVYGLSAELAHQMLTVAVYHIREEGMRYEAGQQYDELLTDYKVEFRTHPKNPLNMTGAYYKGLDKEWEALQMVWPDEEGRFPGEEGIDPLIEREQEPKSEL